MTGPIAGSVATQIFINNEYVTPVNGKIFPNYNPSTGELLQNVAACDAADVERAVQAAKACVEGPQWGMATTGTQRAVLLTAMAEEITKDKEAFALLETTDVGKPLGDSRLDMEAVADVFTFYAAQAVALDQSQGQEVKLPDSNFATAVYREPVGVVACITPWNYPLLMAAWKVAPALAAGCSVVLKPSELAPLTCLRLGEVAVRAGLPAGALNIVTGTGLDAGQPLADHPDVAKVSFTGSVPTGVKVMQSAAVGVRGVSLELGGKSAMVVCPDADMAAALDWAMVGIFQNTGQVCSATSRLLVHRDVYPAFVEGLKEKTRVLYVGNPLGPEGVKVKVGPVVSHGQLAKVLSFIDDARQAGATVEVGGGRPAGAPAAGYYVQPTILSGVTPTMAVWQQEVFGPVLCVMAYDSDEEAIRLANGTAYGLAAAVMTKDSTRAQRMARQLRSGIVWVNCSQPTFIEAPWGGMKCSGIGRELGSHGLDAFLEVKQVTAARQPAHHWAWATPS